jgi:RNA polymerase sigma-70 factor (ECF subfamily)
MHETDIQARQFHELYTGHRQKFFRFAYSYIRDEMVAEDIVMDSFMHYWEHRDTLTEDRSPLAYVLTIVRNRCLNHLKAQQVRQRAQGEMHAVGVRVLELQIASMTACDPTELFTREARQIVAKAISELPDRTREVFMRSMLHDQPYKQIITEMNISFSTVDHEMRKAKKILAEKLKRYHPDLLLFLLLLFIH